MAAFLLAFVLILLAIAGLAVGVLFGRPPLKGSCGGAACLKGIDCAACPSRRPEARR